MMVRHGRRSVCRLLSLSVAQECTYDSGICCAVLWGGRGDAVFCGIRSLSLALAEAAAAPGADDEEGEEAAPKALTEEEEIAQLEADGWVNTSKANHEAE